MSVDLHLHTTASDGSVSPRSMVASAAKLGLRAIAVSDHDTIAGVNEALHAGNELGVEVIPALEFSSKFNSRDIHILGYFISTGNAELHLYIECLRDARIKRAEKILECLQCHGVDIDIDEIKRSACNASIGRPHIAKALLEKGYVDSFSEAFHTYLKRDALCYKEKFVYPPDKLISLIHQAGGVAVFAHPGLTDLDEFIPVFVSMGLDGLEAYHSDHTSEMRERYLKLAKKHNLIVTGGSDCHGRASTHGLRLGATDVPDEVVDSLKARVANHMA